MLTAARAAVRGLQRFVPPARGGAVILGYHLVGAGTDGPVDLPTATFRRQMEELRDLATVVHLADALGRVERGDVGSLPTVVLTFDDAYENFRTTIWPVLDRLGLPAMLYVPVGFVDGRCPPPIAGTTGLRAVSWDQLREMTRDGLIRIGSHGDTHCDLRAPGVDLAREIIDSGRTLADRLGVAVDSFCYPRALWSVAAERVVAHTYAHAVAAGGHRVGPGRIHRHRLGRVPVRRDMAPSLAPVLRATVWLEERVAATLRSARC